MSHMCGCGPIDGKTLQMSMLERFGRFGTALAIGSRMKKTQIAMGRHWIPSSLITKTIAVLLAVGMISGTYAAGLSDQLARTTGSFSRYQQASGIDVETMKCLGCHDGVIAKDMGHNAGESRGGSLQNHPVGIRYSSSVMGNYREYMPKAVIDERVKLIDGKVSCVSCHQLKDTTTPEPEKAFADEYEPDFSCTSSGKTTVTTDGSALCLSCHNL